MSDEAAFIWEKGGAARPVPRPQPQPEPPVDLPGGRIPLREASHQFGVSVSTLRSWSRDGKVDAITTEGRWMVTPGSVAARLSERHSGRSRYTRRKTTRAGRSGPSADGTTMLVPRDAWDKLMDQLGNLHEAGQMLAEARERAAKAETEAVFLRERLGEMRQERDRLADEARTDRAPPSRFDRWMRRLFGT